MADVGFTRASDPIAWPVIHDRIAYLKKLVRGMDVLDIGCTGRKGSGRLPDHAGTLHHAIRPVCASLTGVDIDAGGVDAMRAAGYRVVLGDAASVSLNQAFDVIIAAEVIEHLSNPGATLANLRTHLKENGTLVVTTCNPFYYRQQSRILRHGIIQVNATHTCWFDPLTLERLLQRYGLRVIRGAWLSPHNRWNPMMFMARWRKYWHANFLVEARPTEVRSPTSVNE